jgi:epoxyqueuosine reductase
MTLLDDLKAFGVTDFGYTEEDLPVSYQQYLNWLDQNKHGPLKYLADHRKEKRASLKNFYPEFQSALVFLFSYNEKSRELKAFYQTPESNGLKIASYVFAFDGKDYHFEIKDRLEKIKSYFKLDGVLTLDVHPVLERDLAYRSGLGWFGKNSMLINRTHGSFFLIGSLLLAQKLKLPQKKLETDHCGQCRACIDACPTVALDENTRTLDAAKCISSISIEIFKEDGIAIPLGYPQIKGEIFGCDICQDVCPWNLRLERFLAPAKQMSKTIIKDFFLTPPFNKVLEKLTLLSLTQYKASFARTPLERTGKNGLLKNLRLLIRSKS